MGTASLFGILILVVIILIYGGSIFGGIVDATSDAFEFSKLFFDAEQLKIKPESGEQICDLKIVVFGELTETLPFSTLFVRIGDKTDHPEERTYQWFNCNPATELPLASLLNIGVDTPTEQRSYPIPLALFLVEEQISAQIVLESGPFKVDAVTQPSLKKTIKIPAGDIPLPFDVRATFVVTDIPDRDYDLKIFYGREINNLNPGEPFISCIAKSTKSSC